MKIKLNQLKSLIREEITRLNEKFEDQDDGLLTFKYNPKGLDNDGNNGPMFSDPGWITVKAPDYEDAVRKLPLAAQKKIFRAVKKEGSDSVKGFLQDTCGWGVGFSFGCVENGEFDDEEM